MNAGDGEGMGPDEVFDAGMIWDQDGLKCRYTKTGMVVVQLPPNNFASLMGQESEREIKAFPEDPRMNLDKLVFMEGKHWRMNDHRVTIVSLGVSSRFIFSSDHKLTGTCAHFFLLSLSTSASAQPLLSLLAPGSLIIGRLRANTVSNRRMCNAV